MFKITSNSIETDTLQREIGEPALNFTLTTKNGVTTIVFDNIDLQLSDNIDLEAKTIDGAIIHPTGQGLAVHRHNLKNNILALEQRLSDLFLLYADEIKKLK